MDTLFIGKNTIFLPETDSTNSYAIGLLKNVNLPEGTVVHAAAQRAGKGQRGTRWNAEPHRNLTVSVLLKPSFLDTRNHFILYQAAALSCVDTLARFMNSSQFDIKIKWPNDILVNGRKMCGILIENTVHGEQIRNSILGFGINLNQERFSDSPDATSFRLLTGETIDPHAVLAHLCSALESLYLLLREGRHDEVRARYLEKLYGLYCTLPFEMDKRVRNMKVKGVHHSGLLELEDEQGSAVHADVKQIRWLSLRQDGEAHHQDGQN